MTEQMATEHYVSEFNVPSERAILMEFTKDGQRGEFDIVDGEFIYTGDLPVSDAARMLFETLADNLGDWWIERARRKTTSS
jgi:hypothetical protein